jgi:hypothetical protein
MAEQRVQHVQSVYDDAEMNAVVGVLEDTGLVTNQIGAFVAGRADRVDTGAPSPRQSSP